MKHKMIMAVIPREEAKRVIDVLVEAGYTATTLDSRGGVLRQAQRTFFIAVETERLADVLGIIRENCRHEVAVSGDPVPLAMGAQPVTAQLGGAIVFVWDLDRVESY